MQTTRPDIDLVVPAPPLSAEPDLPKLSELGLDLLSITPFQRLVTLAAPFLYVALYFFFAWLNHWPAAVFALMCLSFITYGSISHDLVHRTLGLSRRTNDLFLSVIELLALRSGHAYRLVHLYHHKRFPNDDDIEGAASKMTLLQTLVEGTTLQLRIYRWALQHAASERARIVLEGLGGVALLITAVALLPVTAAPFIYVVLMVMGSWIIPLITSHIPHDPTGQSALYQTRLFRGVVVSVIALEHLYHLEHHLYPAVPHHNWPRLAKRLDPYFNRMGLKPIKLWF
jgi:beta-carotene hydroxylase